MKKYAVIIFIFLISFQAYSQEESSIDNMQGIYPKNYFNSDNISYYFNNLESFFKQEMSKSPSIFQPIK